MHIAVVDVAKWIAICTERSALGWVGAIKRHNHFQDGTFDDRADAELQRLVSAFASAEVECAAAKEVKYTSDNFAADDLLLVGNNMDNFQCLAVNEAKIDPDIHDGEAHGGAEADAGWAEIVIATFNTIVADVEIQFCDAAYEVVVAAAD